MFNLIFFLDRDILEKIINYIFNYHKMVTKKVIKNNKNNNVLI